jgi:hypothetical protein
MLPLTPTISPHNSCSATQAICVLLAGFRGATPGPPLNCATPNH